MYDKPGVFFIEGDSYLRGALLIRTWHYLEPTNLVQHHQFLCAAGPLLCRCYWVQGSVDHILLMQMGQRLAASFKVAVSMDKFLEKPTPQYGRPWPGYVENVPVIVSGWSGYNVCGLTKKTWDHQWIPSVSIREHDFAARGGSSK